MTNLNKLFKFSRNCLAIIGMIGIAFMSFAVYTFMSTHKLSFMQIISKSIQEAGIYKSRAVRKNILSKRNFSDYRFQGIFKKNHPRILYKDMAEVESIRHRYKTDSEYIKKTDAYTKGAYAWFCKKDYARGEAHIAKLVNANISSPKDVGNYGNAMSIALQYDMLYDHPAWTEDQRQRIHILFRKYIKEAINVLEGNSASLWHGRFQLACATWVVASVMDIYSTEDLELLAKAQAHFLDSIEAIRLSGGWPEGYNYWINNRAYPFALACLSHLNSVNHPKLNRKISQTLDTVGLWTIYGTRPDGRFALFGDTGPRNDLKEETQRFIDLVSLGTKNSIFKYYSAYLDTRYKGGGYHYSYRWEIPVFRGLPEFDFSKKLIFRDLAFLSDYLPNSRIFGHGAFNQVFMRSGWGKNDTFVSYRAGDSFSHHGHYQAGHFTLFKYSPLALTSGTYGGYTSPHRLNYYIRTIASNSILIQKPSEIIKPNKFFKENSSAGGQRIIIPTGSAVTSVENWKINLNKGRHYKGGSITAFDNSDSAYVYINSDLTNAYTKEKAVKVERELCYLNKEDLLIIHDVVESRKQEYSKKWLFHTWSKPETETEKVLLGSSSNGIILSTDKNIQMVHKRGMVKIAVILPEDPIIYKIGGIDYRYYVETDGDDSVFDGVNMVEGAREKSWFDSGLWRIEIKSKNDKLSDEFLVLLKPDQAMNKKPISYTKFISAAFAGIEVNNKIIAFPRNYQENGSVYYFKSFPGKKNFIFGMPKNKNVVIIMDNKEFKIKISKYGVLKFNTSNKLPSSIRIRII